MKKDLEKIYETFAPLHFSPKQGWMNDPNGLAYYKGQYHFFYQHNPHHFQWDAMHWGYATSIDGYKWIDQPIALYPDEIYSTDEYIGGQFSGSALKVNGELLIMFTHHHERLGEPCIETQYLTKLLDDGTLAEPQLISDHVPEDSQSDNRDPKLFEYNDELYFITSGLSKDDKGIVNLYKQKGDEWVYEGRLFTDEGNTRLPIECPDLYPLGDKWVLCLSYQADYIHPYTQLPTAVMAYIGNFDGKKFTPHSKGHMLDFGPDSYAPQTFIGASHERIFVPWAANPSEAKNCAEYPSSMGRLRIVSLKDDQIFMKPWAWPEEKIQQKNELIHKDQLPAFISYHFEGIKELNFQIGDGFSIIYKDGIMKINQAMPHRHDAAKSEFSDWKLHEDSHLEISFDGHICEIIWNHGKGWATYRSHISYEDLNIRLDYMADNLDIFTS